MPPRELIAGIDVGGTKIAGGLVCAGTGEVIFRTRIPTPDGGNQVILKELAGLVRAMLDRPAGQVLGLGIGIPGKVDREKGVAVSAANLDFDHMPVKEPLESEFGLPVFLENDTNAGALGEKWFGRGRGFKNFIYLALGTGIGGGIILDSRLYVGNGRAGELGHIITDPGGERCVCGARGCVEVTASGPGIARMARRKLEEGKDSTLRGPFLEKGTLTAEDVFGAAACGDSLSQRVITRAGRSLAVACINLINIFDPDLIVIGGGVAAAGKLLIESITRGSGIEGFKEVLSDRIALSALEASFQGPAGVFREHSENLKGTDQ